MKKIIAFALTFMIAIGLFAFAGCSTARGAPSVEKAGLTQLSADLASNKQAVEKQSVTAVARSGSALLSNKAQLAVIRAYTISVEAPARVKITEEKDIGYDSAYMTEIRKPPNFKIFRGIGHDHFARADV